MQALILAAGMGKRLKDLTRDATKCMVMVNGVTLIERMLKQLDKLKLTKIVLVVGYKAEDLRSFISGLELNTPVEYVENEIYYKTNNIYSLYLARHCLLEEDTLLLESDLIFDDAVLETLLNDPYPSLALVAKYESWMDGTVVKIDGRNNILAFLNKKDFHYNEIPLYYKTVNIYKFSRQFSSTHYVPFLEAYSKALGTNEYYEQVLKVITLLDRPEIKALPIEGMDWYEIDDMQDLDIAESIFVDNATEKLSRIEKRYGGYWRYPHMLDYCYLVNPFFPPTKMMDEIKANFDRLLITYPSGQEVNSLLAAKYYGLQKKHVVTGNGAAELIKALLERLQGHIGVVMPTFEEYPNRKPLDILPYTPQNNDYSYTADDLMAFFNDKDISALILINPDNPSGNYIKHADVLRLIEWAKNHTSQSLIPREPMRIIVDESFVDFADTPDTLLDESILDSNPHLTVIKSISKSFGVPGLRLGILACGDNELVKLLKKDVSIWNINSFAEFYLQIFEKYQSDYMQAMDHFRETRAVFLRELSEIEYVRPIATQANYVMCELKNPYTSLDVTRRLLDKAGILIKNLAGKSGISGEYIRVAIKTPEENERLIEALKAL